MVLAQGCTACTCTRLHWYKLVVLSLRTLELVVARVAVVKRAPKFPNNAVQAPAGAGKVAHDARGKVSYALYLVVGS